MNPSLTTQQIPLSAEWLEADGLGGFASGTSTGIRTRRYHALLLTATTPPSGRMVLVNGFDAWVETPNGKFSLSSQCYLPDVIGGDGAMRIEAFDWNPSPHWIFKLEDGTRIEQEIFVPKGQPLTCISWTILGPRKDVKLFVRPFLSGRDYHSLHKSNPAFRFDAKIGPGQVAWHPYDGVPAVSAITNGEYSHEPLWYYNFLYEEERARGLNCEEDLASPGIFSWDLSKGKAALILTTKEHASAKWPKRADALDLHTKLREGEKNRRAAFPSKLHRAADAYIVPRGEGKTIIAGYPWFTDWGRDTFIAVRGLCLATGRLEDARDILLAWTNVVSDGMLPNRFPDRGERPEFNAVDASLWFIIASYEYLQAAKGSKTFKSDREALAGAIEAILEGYSKGTRYGIHLDDDGLLVAGERGVQLTWMDAKVGEWIVTQRAGKPVEVQALWLNALKIASEFSPGWTDSYERCLNSFRERFWNEAAGCLYDVVDVNHNRGEVDSSFRPNQILAVGGLPFSMLGQVQAMQVVAAVEERLWTPLGLRSLSPDDKCYSPHYHGGVTERDGSYHQGTVWPWLIGPFVEAWVRVRGATNQAKREARNKFLAPIFAHLEEAGLGHISEIADAEPQHTPRGCPFQAWSVGEVLRLDKIVLAESPETTRSPKARRKIAQTPQPAVSI
jgi:predicted glycogen debranching enzyme